MQFQRHSHAIRRIRVTGIGNLLADALLGKNLLDITVRRADTTLLRNQLSSAGAQTNQLLSNIIGRRSLREHYLGHHLVSLHLGEQDHTHPAGVNQHDATRKQSKEDRHHYRTPLQDAHHRWTVDARHPVIETIVDSRTELFKEKFARPAALGYT